MIIKATERSGAKHLADHLMNQHDNDHITVHAINGFMANDVHGALSEAYGISKATKCKKFMFSLSLSPPEDAVVSVEDFENAINDIGDKLGLSEQPHVVLFHEKNARRHCHVVYSRIDLQEMKAINLSYYKEKLNDIAREQYLIHGWDLPKGFQNRALSDPQTYTLEEYQVAKRAKRDPREIKAVLKNCWQQSDSKPAFEAALQEKGFYLCKGDRRGFVALDWQGNIYSLSRWTGEKPKALKAKLGEPSQLLSVDDKQHEIDLMMDGKRKEFAQKLEADFSNKLAPLEDQRLRLVKRQRIERRKLFVQQKTAHKRQAIDQSARLRTGLRGLWDWLNGNRKKILHRNKQELEDIKRQYEAQLLALLQRHQVERLVLKEKFMRLKATQELSFEGLDTEFERWHALIEVAEKNLEKEGNRDRDFDNFR
ncbi:MAG: relaxase/mobilization nuclease domain-containing protein [Cohaesibacter sp.]|nr:relaxase/mobilization nuclease domain-containing protein [Cohaesibacter sp.]